MARPDGSRLGGSRPGGARRAALWAAVALVAVTMFVPFGHGSESAGEVIPADMGAARIGASAQTSAALGSSQQQADTDPAEVREEIGRILERDEFSYEKSLFGRFVDWILEQLAKLIPDREPTVAVGAPPGVGAAAYVVAAVLILAALAVVILAVIRVRRRRDRDKPDGDEADVTKRIRENEPEEQWLEEALDMEGAGDWKGSVLVRYRRLVEELVQRGRLAPTPGLTPGELSEDLRSSMPSAGPLFDEATQLFEDPWYGDEPTGSPQAERLTEISTRILTSPDAGTDTEVPAP